jgi:hypothetical protein
MPYDPQNSYSTISLFIAANTLEQNPSGTAKPLSNNSANYTELDVSLSTSQDPTI